MDTPNGETEGSPATGTGAEGIGLPLELSPTAKALVEQTIEVLATRSVLHLDEPIELASGQMSHHFVDAKAGLSHAADLRLACETVATLAREAGVEFDAVGGLTLGADHLAVGIALATDREWFFVRKEPKKRGTAKLIEGATLDANVRVLVVEDAVSTGSSLLQAIEAVEATGARVVGAATMIDRGGHLGPVLAERGVRYLPVASHTDLGLPPVAKSGPKTTIDPQGLV